MDPLDRRTHFARCLKYMHLYDLGPILQTPTLSSISNFFSFHLGAQEHRWRHDFARPFLLCDALYVTLYTFICAA